MRRRTTRPERRLATILVAVALWAGAPGHAQTGQPRAASLYEDALARFEKKDIAGAIIQLKNALQLDRQMLPVHVLLGKALLARGEVVAAEAAFEEALRLGVNRSEVVLPLAQAVAGQARPQALLEHERFSLAGLPPQIKARLLLIKAEAAGDANDAHTAIKMIEESRAIDPARVEAWLAEVPIRLRANQIAPATAAADKAIAIDAGSADALYLRGSIAHVQFDRATAVSWYDRALRLNPGHVEALVSRAGLLMDMDRPTDAARDVAELRRSTPSDPRGAYLAALIAERQGDAKSAREGLIAVTSLLDPIPIQFMRYRTQLLLLGGLAHHGLDQREKARPYLEAALRNQPQSPVAKLLAQIYLAERNIDRAIPTLEGYLKGHPNDAQAQHLLASAHLAQGRHARAATITQEALQKQDLPAMRGLLGLSLIGASKYIDATAELEKAVSRDPSQVQAGSALAALYLQGGQPAKAVRVVEMLVKHHPNSAGLQQLLGSARARNHDGRGARAAYLRAIELSAGLTTAQVGLAQLDIAENAHDKAMSRLSAVLAKEDKNIAAMMEMGRLHALMGQPGEAQRWLEKAEDHAGTRTLRPGIGLVEFQLAQGRPDLAREAIRRLTAKAPEAPEVLTLLARVHLANGEKSEAGTVLTRASTLAGFNAPALVQIAILQLGTGQLAAAARSLDKALSDRPDFMPAHLVLSDVEIQQGELAKAEQRARRMVADYPKLGIGYALLGDVARARNQRQAAADHYRRAHQLDQTADSVLRLIRGLSGLDNKAADQVAEQWLKTHPRHTSVRRALADSQARAGNLVAARASYQALLQTDPDDAEALNNLAHVLLQLGDPKAQSVADQALARRPGAAHIVGTAGWVAFKSGQPDRALQLLRDARLRNPANAETRYYLGAVLASVGRNGEARAELEGALAQDKAFASADAAADLLKTLK